MTRLPHYVETRVRAGSAWTPPVASPAATVVLVRDNENALETYVIRRAMTMPFAPGMYVFPGGRVSEEDFGAARAHVDDARRMNASLELAGALVNCAVRELAEETGVRVSAPVGSGHLPVIAHWITPEVEERRYDVRFFGCLLPAGQEPELLGTEADAALWVGPSAAIEQFRGGAMPLLPPTLAVLTALSECDAAAQVIDELARRPVQPLMPRASVDETDQIRWSLVNAHTGIVVRPAQEMPHAWEARGVRG